MNDERRTTNDEILRRLDKIDGRIASYDARLRTLEDDKIARAAVLRFLKLVGTVVLLAVTLRFGDIPRIIHSLQALLHGGNSG